MRKQKKEITTSFNILKYKLTERKDIFSKAKLRKAWDKDKEEGCVLFNRDKS